MPKVFYLYPFIEKQGLVKFKSFCLCILQHQLLIRMKKLTLILMVAALAFATSCKKDEDSNSPAPTSSKSKTEKLTARAWKVTARTISPAINVNGTMVTDLHALDDECDKDDLYKFKIDKTFTLEEGATKCDPADPQIYGTGTWAFNADETQLILTYAGIGTSTSNILEVTETTAKLSQVETSNGVQYTTTTTYTAQ